MFRVTALRFVAWVKQLFPLESLRPNQRMSRNGRATCRSTLHETGVSPQMQNQMEMREAGLPPPKWSQTANWAAALICSVNDKLLALTCALGERAATPIATWGLTLMFDAILARQAAAGPARPVADQRALALVPLVVFVPKGAVSEARDNPNSLLKNLGIWLVYWRAGGRLLFEKPGVAGLERHLVAPRGLCSRRYHQAGTSFGMRTRL